MYLITNKQNKILEIANRALYVIKQKNGVVIPSPQNMADAIYVDDSNTFYPLKSTEYMPESYDLVEVDDIPDYLVAGYYYYNGEEFYSTEADLSALYQATMQENVPEAILELADGQSEITVAILELADLVLGG